MLNGSNFSEFWVDMSEQKSGYLDLYVFLWVFASQSHTQVVGKIFVSEDLLLSSLLK